MNTICNQHQTQSKSIIGSCGPAEEHRTCNREVVSSNHGSATVSKKGPMGQIQNWSSLRRTELLFSTVLSFQSEAQTLYVYHMDKQPLPSAKTPMRRSHDQTCYRSNTFKSATDGILL